MRVNLFLLFSLYIFFISICSATCGQNQININTASLSDLDKLTGIGPTYAQAIIDGRPYSSLDELDKVRGIGIKTIEKIKSQNLACLESGTSTSSDIAHESITTKEANTIIEKKESKIITSKIAYQAIETKNPEVNISITQTGGGFDLAEKENSESIINLNSNSNSVKGKVIYESRNEIIRKYAIYAFAIFLLAVITFLLLDKNGRTKNYSSDDY